MKNLLENDQYLLYKDSKSVFFICARTKATAFTIPLRLKVKESGKMFTFAPHLEDTLLAEIQSDSLALEMPPEMIKENLVKKKPERPKKVDSADQPKPKKQVLGGLEMKAVRSLPDAKYDPTKPVAKVFFDGQKIAIKHGFDVKLNDIYKRFSFAWNSDEKRREKKLTSLNLESCHFVLKLPEMSKGFFWDIDYDVRLFLNTKIKEYEAEEEKSIKAQVIKKDFATQIDTSAFRIEPYPYQKAGIGFLNAIDGNGIVGDEMGIGKTVQAIGFATINSYRTIVVCPASLKYNWKNEIEKFTTGTCLILSDDKKLKEIPQVDFIIVNYEQLKKFQKLIEKVKFDLVILDESHYIKNLQAARTKLVMNLFKKVPHKVLLSGTAIKNRPIEFYSQLKFIKPKLFSNKMNFALRYCNAKPNQWGGWDMDGASNLEELNQKISGFYIRRTKQEVLPELPEKIRTVIDIEMSSEEKKAYNNIKADIKEYYEKNPGNTSDLAKLGEMKMFCSHTKVSRVVEFVENILEQDEKKKVIVFSGYIKTQKELAKAFGNRAVTLFGEDAPEKRQKSVDTFQSDPKARIFVGSTLAAGVGITLTAADTVVFADLLWSPADHEQAEDRANRIGQKNTVFIYYLNFRDSIEQMIWKALGNKQKIIDQVLEDS